MLKTADELGWKLDEADRLRDRKWAMVALVAYALVSLVWAFAADAPWDDDCPTRFFNTQNAFQDPVNFVSVWNRPLFVLIFALPAQLGKAVVPILMTLISSLGAWLLWRGLRQQQVPHAWLAIPLLAFQPFFFGTSRVALTEPLAAVLLCAGFCFLAHKKWMGYAIVGGLLPLARLEMSIVLAIWAVPLIQSKQWKHLLWMALPLVAWNIAGGIITGDFNYVFNQTFGADTGENRYGNTTFGHYFRRSMWITGPVVFWFLLQGLAFRTVRKGLSLWVDGQLVLGLLLYVVFSWKMSMGNAAGFLRNLVPLTPLVAIIALDGYNRSMAALMGSSKAAASRKKDLLLVGLVAALTLFLGIQLFADRLQSHQLVIPLPDWSRVVVLAVVAGLMAIIWLRSRSGSAAQRPLLAWVPVAVATLTMGYALYQEPPAVSNNNDRQAMGIIANFYVNSELSQRPTYVNHNWFFWVAGENPQNPKFKRVTIAELEAAPVGAIIIWDYHYSTRLAGDVGAQYLIDHLEYVELLRIGVANRGEAVLVLEKTGRSLQAQEIASKAFSDAHPKYLPAIMARSFRLLAVRRFEEALQLLEYALGSVQNDPDIWFGHGYALLNLAQFEAASISLHNSVMLAPRFPSAWFNLGRAYAGASDMASGIAALNRALAFDPYAEEAWFSRGAIKSKIGDLQGAIADFSQTLLLNPKHVQALTNRAAAYAMSSQPEAALRDITTADILQPGDPEILFIKGRMLLQAGQKDAGCALMQQAVAAGLDKADAFIAKQCGGAAPVDSTQSAPR